MTCLYIYNVVLQVIVVKQTCHSVFWWNNILEVLLFLEKNSFNNLHIPQFLRVIKIQLKDEIMTND
jgi:hypothetical protein